MTVFGEIIVDGNYLQTRDAIGISETDSFKITAEEDSGLLFIEVPIDF